MGAPRFAAPVKDVRIPGDAFLHPVQNGFVLKARDKAEEEVDIEVRRVVESVDETMGHGGDPACGFDKVQNMLRRRTQYGIGPSGNILGIGPVAFKGYSHSTHMSPLMPYYRFKNPSIPARAPGKARFSTMAREAMT